VTSNPEAIWGDVGLALFRQMRRKRRAAPILAGLRAQRRDSMSRQNWLVVRRLIGAAAPLTMLGLMAQAVDAQTVVAPGNAPEKTAPHITNPQDRGGPSQGGPSNVCIATYPTSNPIGKLNYIINNQCNAIHDLHLRFVVTKQLTAKHDNEVKHCNPSKVTKQLTTTKGIYIQFNAFSKDAPKALIQYIFVVSGTTITPHIQYWGGTPDMVDHDWKKHWKNPYGIQLATSNSLDPGYVFEVDLSTNDKGYVTAAKFTVTDLNGRQHFQDALPATNSGSQAGRLFPLRISEFQTNIVSTDGHYVDFAKDGAGTLSYTSRDQLNVEGGNFEHCAAASGDFHGGTCETSNASYSCPAGVPLTQSVTVE
jgi:hypothetical protein